MSMSKNFLIFFPFAIFLCIFALFGCSKPGDNLVTSGIDAFKKKDYDAAITYLTDALESETNYSNELIYTLLANTYTQKHEWNTAISYHKKALELREDYSSYILLGALCHEAQRDEEAESAYKQAIALEPKRAEGYGSLGALYLKQEKIDEAIELLEKTISINPRLGIVHADLAVAYAKKGNAEKAEVALKEAEERKAENFDTFKARVDSILGKAPALNTVPEAK